MMAVALVGAGEAVANRLHRRRRRRGSGPADDRPVLARPQG